MGGGVFFGFTSTFRLASLGYCSSTGAVLALLLALLTESMISLLSGRWSWGFSSIWAPSTSRLASLGCCSGTGAVLALLRLVVRHALVLFIALSIGGVLGTSNSTGVFSSCLLLAGVLGILFGFISTLRLASFGCYSGLDAVLALLRPVVPYTLSVLRSALGRFLDRWYLTYQRSSWRCWPGR